MDSQLVAKMSSAKIARNAYRNINKVQKKSLSVSCVPSLSRISLQELLLAHNKAEHVYFYGDEIRRFLLPSAGVSGGGTTFVRR
jgi:hypothetical protein